MVALGVIAINEVALPPPPLVLVPPRPPQVRTARYPTVEFGESLRRQCASFSGVSGVTVTCTALRQRLPWAVASQLTLITEELLARAFMAFEGGRGGRIGVSFGAVPTSFQLTVEHSRPPTAASDRQLGRSATLVWRVVDRLGGRLQSPRMIGGVRTVVTVPRP